MKKLIFITIIFTILLLIIIVIIATIIIIYNAIMITIMNNLGWQPRGRRLRGKAEVRGAEAAQHAG